MSKQSKVKNIEVDALKGQLARALADYDNLMKRVEREREEIQKIVSLGLIIKLLSVLDGFESAQEHLKDAGLAISIGEFKKVLSEEGLTEISPKTGDKFDEQTMEAIEVTSGEGDNDSSGAGNISEVVLVGWKFADPSMQSDGTVVRHAKVKVTKKE